MLSRNLMIAGLGAAVLAVAAVVAGATGHGPSNSEVLRSVKITQRISVAAVKRSNTSRDLLKEIQADPSDPEKGISVPNSRVMHPAYFVVMREDGSTERSTLANVQTLRTGVGHYELLTGRDVSQCAWTGTAQARFGFFTTTGTTIASTTNFAHGLNIGVDPTNPRRLGIRVSKDTGESVDAPLHITIVC